MSSRMLLLPELRRLVDLQERGAVAAGLSVGVWLFLTVQEFWVCCSGGADSGVEAGVLVVQDEENKGVCVEAVVVQGLEAETAD